MDGGAKENCCEINTVKNEQCLHCTFKNGIYEDIKNWMNYHNYADNIIFCLSIIISSDHMKETPIPLLRKEGLLGALYQSAKGHRPFSCDNFLGH